LYAFGPNGKLSSAAEFQWLHPLIFFIDLTGPWKFKARIVTRECEPEVTEGLSCSGTKFARSIRGPRKRGLVRGR
jgi:hypothetical protein